MAIAAEVCKERRCEDYGGSSASNFGSSYDCGYGYGFGLGSGGDLGK